MNRFPGMLRSVNDSLDEMLLAIEKVNTLCQSAEQLTPALKQLGGLLGEVKRTVELAKPERVSHRMQAKVSGGTGDRRRRKRPARRPRS
ncbi:hypothetical protein [Paenibacillus sp. YYML68]|uniref:hypothetical protein n=1 Tax=Paenibacillus sp. YYML68 TaxID=2909250 RepID=UPI00249295B2|nr:hypothetical protein [Paenibacillus sp. YYML68]